jgi:hypothetical protein
VLEKIKGVLFTPKKSIFIENTSKKMPLINIRSVVSSIAGLFCGIITYVIIYTNRFPQFNAFLESTGFFAGARSTVVILAGFLGSYLMRKRMLQRYPLAVISPPASSPNPVGIRELGATLNEKTQQVDLPPLSVFYPSTGKSTGPSTVSWLPNNGDLRFNGSLAGFAAEAQALVPGTFSKKLVTGLFSFAFRHFAMNRIKVRLNDEANAEVLVKKNAQPSKTLPARIIILCHGMAGHSHCHTKFALELLNELPGGAGVVICPNFADESTFALLGGADHRTNQQHSPNHAVEFVDSKWAINLKEQPCDEFIAWRETQLAKRVHQVDCVMKWIGDKKNGLAAALFPGDTKLQVDFLKKHTVEGKVEIRLVGHSFGGSTVIAAAGMNRIDGNGAVRVQSVVALDVWMAPLSKIFVEAEEKNKSGGEKLPPLLLIDSEHWERFKVNKSWEERLMKIWNGNANRIWTAGSDHYTLLDMCFFVPSNSRLPYTKKENDSSNINEWATKSMIKDDRF